MEAVEVVCWGLRVERGAVMQSSPEWESSENVTPKRKRKRVEGGEESTCSEGGPRRSTRACSMLASERLKGRVRSRVDLFAPKKDFVELVKEVVNFSRTEHKDFFEVYEDGVEKVKFEPNLPHSGVGWKRGKIRSEKRESRKMERGGRKPKSEEKQGIMIKNGISQVQTRSGGEATGAPGGSAVNRTNERLSKDKDQKPDAVPSGQGTMNGNSRVQSSGKVNSLGL